MPTRQAANLACNVGLILPSRISTRPDRPHCSASRITNWNSLRRHLESSSPIGRDFILDLFQVAKSAAAPIV